MKIAVAGATGRVGRHVVDLLELAGHDVVAMSRANGVDVVTGAGLDEALAGVDSIVDAAGAPSEAQEAATRFFTTSARNLQRAGSRAGVQRIVVVSIIGIDRFTAGYMAAKIAHERAMEAGPIPVRLLRAAQFHELVSQFVEWGRRGHTQGQIDVSHVPKIRTQLVAARTVAQVLAKLATDLAPASQSVGAPILEIAGPRAENLADAAARLVARRGDPVRIEETVDLTDPDRELYETDALLAGPHAIIAGPTFDEWLDASLSGRAVDAGGVAAT
jgi:uncharacterized protein YbjT (DUF2867 family)